jgi:predicted transcriptional regulator
MQSSFPRAFKVINKKKKKKEEKSKKESIVNKTTKLCMAIKHKILSERKKKIEKSNTVVKMVMPKGVYTLITWN